MGLMIVKRNGYSGGESGKQGKEWRKWSGRVLEGKGTMERGDGGVGEKGAMERRDGGKDHLT